MCRNLGGRAETIVAANDLGCQVSVQKMDKSRDRFVLDCDKEVNQLCASRPFETNFCARRNAGEPFRHRLKDFRYAVGKHQGYQVHPLDDGRRAVLVRRTRSSTVAVKAKGLLGATGGASGRHPLRQMVLGLRIESLQKPQSLGCGQRFLPTKGKTLLIPKGRPANLAFRNN
jgi:hypothetical protein